MVRNNWWIDQHSLSVMPSINILQPMMSCERANVRSQEYVPRAISSITTPPCPRTYHTKHCHRPISVPTSLSVWSIKSIVHWSASLHPCCSAVYGNMSWCICHSLGILGLYPVGILADNWSLCRQCPLPACSPTLGTYKVPCEEFHGPLANPPAQTDRA